MMNNSNDDGDDGNGDDDDDDDDDDDEDDDDDVRLNPVQVRKLCTKLRWSFFKLSSAFQICYIYHIFLSGNVLH